MGSRRGVTHHNILILPIFLYLLNLASCFANSPVVPSPPAISMNQAAVEGKQQAHIPAGQQGISALQKKRMRVPLKEGNIFNRWSFGWAKELIDIGNSKILQLEDIWLPQACDEMSNVSQTFADHYNHEEAKRIAKNVTIDTRRSIAAFIHSPLSIAIRKMYRNDLIRTGCIKFGNTCVQFLPSLIVARILKIVDELGKLTSTVGSAAEIAATTTQMYVKLRKQGILLCLSLFIALGTKTIMENHYFHQITKMGASIRGALSTAVYRKSLLLSSTGRQDSTTGEIVNLMQLDVGRLEGVATSIHILWDGLLQVFGYTSLLLHFLGPSVFAGIAAMVVVIPVQTVFFKKLSMLRSKMSGYTDDRIKLTNEILQGIRVIKSYNWEKSFQERLSIIREKELAVLVESAAIRGFLVSVLSAAPSFVAVISLAMYAYLGNDLSPTKVFTALALFNQLRFPLIFYPMVLNTLAEGRVSLDRMSKFLMKDEVKAYVKASNNVNEAVKITGNASFTWDSRSDDSRGQLRNADITIKKGEMVAIVGPVGSGKSTLLNAILGEIHLQEGTVEVNGKVIYVPQSSWIPNDTLRGVILFGNDYDAGRYEEVISSTCLRMDLATLDSGDMTEIGERGVNLSGGQRQRTSIARAAYEEADVYIFDDPLSALDSDISSQVFQKCLKTLLKNKTRLLVTHQLSVLDQVDRIIVMERAPDGSCRVKDSGSIVELQQRGVDFASLEQQNLETKEEDEEELVAATDLIVEDNDIADIASSPNTIQIDEIAEPAIVPEVGAPHVAKNNTVVTPTPFVASTVAGVKATSGPSSHSSLVKKKNSATSKAIPPLPGKGKLTTVEERAEGTVSKDVYLSYLNSAGRPVLIFITLLSFVLANFSQISQQWIVAAWTSDPLYQKKHLRVYLGGVACMATGVAIFNYLRTYVGCLFGVEASKVMHWNMISTILRAPLSYFESTPAGRILQRFSKDLDAVDQQLPSSLGQFVASALQIIGSIIAIMLVSPNFVLALIPIFYLYGTITNYYRVVARDLKRLDSISRSPLYSHFSETLGGLSVIRAFKRNSKYMRSNEERVDDSVACFNALKIVDRWLSIRLEFLGNLIVLAASVLTITSNSRAGAAGISLNNALSVTSLLNWAVRNVAETENMMNSVERVLFVTNETPVELPHVRNDFNASTLILKKSEHNLNHHVTHIPRNDTELRESGWPWQGGLVLEDVQMRYRADFEQILKGVNLKIQPGQKIGVVGRTGSGKSTIFRALLRLTELEGGKIYIDGIDTSQIGLDALRSAISIIPQDPVLFGGSIRSNLDPFHLRTDEEIWEALEKVNLLETVSNLPGKLSFIVSEGGENFSAGQRQLICLGRALVRRSKLLLLDEATSSVDYETDNLIQRAIREEFKSSTVLTIAHRLNSVLDSDMILCMQDGKVAEFDSPLNLRNNPSSMLSRLLASEGRGEDDEPTHNQPSQQQQKFNSDSNEQAEQVDDTAWAHIDISKEVKSKQYGIGQKVAPTAATTTTSTNSAPVSPQ